MIGVTNLRGGLSSRQIGRPQSVIGVASFRDVRQWKAPKCDRGHKSQGVLFESDWKAPKCDRGREF